MVSMGGSFALVRSARELAPKIDSKRAAIYDGKIYPAASLSLIRQGNTDCIWMC
jgi:hypothetical protein